MFFIISEYGQKDICDFTLTFFAFESCQDSVPKTAETSNDCST